jgi:hypothetical protein
MIMSEQRRNYSKEHESYEVERAEHGLAGDRKFTHEEVDYSKGKPHAHCGLCEHYHGVDDCVLVVAPIRPAMWCRKFEHN